jgi:DNA-binding CsgD family transcriptional regulator
MADAEQLSDLIAKIYDAALDASLWSEVVGYAGRFVGSSVASIFSKNPVDGSGQYHWETGIDPYYRDLYFLRYGKLNPFTMGQLLAEVGEPIAAAELVPYSEFKQTQIYKEWIQPQGMVDYLCVVLDKSATNISCFGVYRYESDGMVDDEMRRRMRLVAPHLRRAVLIGKVLDFKSTESTSFTETLDGLNAGICLVDPVGHIIHANVACREILDNGDPLCSTGGRIAARDRQVHQSLQKSFANAGVGDAAIGTQGIALSLTALNGAHYVVHVLPLTSGARRIADGPNAATAAVFIRRAALEAPHPSEVLARTFRLTPSELRVLLAIVEVGGVPEVAAALEISETTVKTHLRRLFEKTGAERQADLVKIVAGFASPLIG